MTRPAPPQPLHSYHYEASAETSGLGWRLVTGKKCRSGAGPGRKACGRPSVAELNRGYRRQQPAWWAYCEWHLYGRWAEDGQIMHWVLVEDGSDG
jgi:hypothetical protein